jgi:membrane associated rhomboid family serine protease
VIPLRDANPVRRVPIVTIGLIVGCVVAFVYELGTQSTGGDAALERLFRQYGLVPAELSSTFGPGADQAGVMYGELLAIVTSMFLHGGWLHLIGNMLYLWIFGNNIEDRLGRIPFILFYFAGGIAAAVSQVLISPSSDVPVIGASGAIAAVLGAYLILYPRARILALVFLGFFYQLLEVPALVVLGLWFVLQLIDGLASLGVENSAGGVALFEHIGGFVVGVVIGLVVRSTSPRPPSRGLGSLDQIGVG